MREIVRQAGACGALAIALAVGGCGGDDGGGDRVRTVTRTVTAPAPAERPADPCASLRNGESLGFVFVTAPTVGQEVRKRFTASGCANVSEANVRWRLRDGQDREIESGFDTASCGTGCVGRFSFDVAFSVERRQAGVLEVYESSAEDGSEIRMHSVPLVLEP